MTLRGAAGTSTITQQMLHRLVNLRETAVEGELAMVKIAIVDGMAKQLVVARSNSGTS